MSLTITDLFCGAGGSGLGAHAADTAHRAEQGAVDRAARGVFHEYLRLFVAPAKVVPLRRRERPAA